MQTVGHAAFHLIGVFACGDTCEQLAVATSKAWHCNQGLSVM